MRVLFIERNLRNEKLGIMYLSASLKSHGHHADLIQIDKEDIDLKIQEYKPDFIAFSITSGEHVFALKVARDIKQRYGIPNIFGGPHCTFFPEIAKEPGVDFVVQGQGEAAILDVVEGRIKPGLHKSDMAQMLDSFQFPDREIFYQYSEFRDNPIKNVITSRACPYRCAYCYNHSQIELTKMDGETKQWFNRRTVDNVIEEIKGIRENYKLEKIIFIDDSFIQSKKWLVEFLDKYADQVNLPWLCSLRANCFDEQIAENMHKANLEMINYAIESADPHVQQHLLQRGNIKNRDVLRAISLFDQFGVRARMQNMIGMPLLNPLEDALNTLQFNTHHKVTDSWCSIFQPYPRTALGQYCLEHGYVSEEMVDECHESFFDKSILNIDHRDEIYALQKMWYFIIEGDIPLDLAQTLIKGNLSEALADDLQELRYACSREKLYGLRNPVMSATGQPGDERAQSNQVKLLREALKSTQVPAKFIQLVEQIPFAEQQIDELRRYIAGEQVNPTPIYTIDDETGELKDQKTSIYLRGCKDAKKMDINEISPVKFMAGMDSVRDELLSAQS